jgi:site-specific recombinase XerD
VAAAKRCLLCRARHNRHEGACRLLADGVDIRMIQLMLGHAGIQQTQRYLNITDEELRKGLEVSWGRQLRAGSGQ